MDNKNEKIEKAINDAIASKQTSKHNRALLNDILKELEKAKSEKDFLDIILKLINIVGAIAKIFF